jgi:hypothetical protein
MVKAKSLAMKMNNPAKNGAWNSGTKGHGKRLRKSEISQEERFNAAERMKKQNPNAAGLIGRKAVKLTDIATQEVLFFDGLYEAERQIRQLTGKVINHTSVWLNMKKNCPYKGYIWKFEE